MVRIVNIYIDVARIVALRSTRPTAACDTSCVLVCSRLIISRAAIQLHPAGLIAYGSSAKRPRSDSERHQLIINECRPIIMHQ